ncbi:MAG: DUF4336 domain-containing protein [Thermoanaerobaculales bacterium]|nr:DUF4336 domain-containing protein [Thermoanaerobaculales bacterium]
MVATALKQRGTELWTADGQADAGVPGFLRKYDFSTRMTVIRLPDGGLFLHSPVRLDDRLRGELDALGSVRAVVAPNKAHHLYVGDYRVPYPKARFYGALGLQTKRKDLAFFAMLGDEPMPEWRGTIEQRFFRGAPWLNEVVFFHPASRTLLLTDLAFNVPVGKQWGIPFVFKLMGAEGVFGPHRFIRWSIRDRNAALRSLRTILEWDFDRVIVTHGDIVETGGKAKMKKAFAFILDPS